MGIIFRSQSHKEDGVSNIKISDAKSIPLPENSQEAKKMKMEQENKEAEQLLADMSDMSVSDVSTDLSRDNVFTCETACNSEEEEESVSTKGRYNTTDLTPVIAASINNEVSNYATAAIVTATLISYGIITPDDDSQVVCEMKIRRAKEQYRESMREQRNAAVSLPGVVSMVSFDAKEARKPKAEKMINGRNYVVNGGPEDQYVVTMEPQGQYLTQFEVKEEASEGRPYALITAEVLKKSVEELGIPWSQILITGHDTENTNTGRFGGVAAWLEHLIGRKLERGPCMLHMNELYYRAACVEMGVKTLRDNKWTGPIGRLLSQVKELEFDPDFEPVPGETELLVLSPEVVADLSSDQKTLYKLVHMVKTGEKIPNIEEYRPAELSQARWLTQASAMLRIYFSKHGLDASESRKLRIIVNTIIDAYAPMWFLIKTRPKLVEAPRHWFRLLQIAQKLDEEIRDVVIKNITRNAYYFHSESILLCYVASDDRAEREFAVRMIKLIRCRQGDSSRGNKAPRVRTNPTKLNLAASSLAEVIDERQYKHESLLTCDIPTSELDTLIESPLEVLPYPSHTQSVERNIRRMTQAGQKVSTLKKRDGVILTQQVVSQHYNSASKRSKKDLHSLTQLSTYAESLNNHKLQPKQKSI